VVLAPLGWRQVCRFAMSALTGATRCDPRATVTKTSWTPGRARSKPLKPLRGEGRTDPVGPVVTNSCAFSIRTRGCGCNGHPAFPAPSVLEGRRWHNSGVSAPRECGALFCSNAQCGQRRIAPCPPWLCAIRWARGACHRAARSRGPVGLADPTMLNAAPQDEGAMCGANARPSW
jgi:hypothetical protein